MLKQTDWFEATSPRRTNPVGQLKANPFGLFDVHGNVEEWTQDGFDPTFYTTLAAKSDSGRTNPVPFGNSRVVRGGHWFESVAGCRSAIRLGRDPQTRNRYRGFRVALPVDALREALKGPAAKEETAARTPANTPTKEAGSSQEATASALPTVARVDPDRKAAESIIALGGSVGLLVGEKESVSAGNLDQIPHDRFIVTRITLDNKDELPENPLDNIKDCRAVEELSLHTSLAIRDRDLASIREFESLRIVTLTNDRHLTGGCLKYLAKSKKLNNLFLWGVSVKDADMLHLQGHNLTTCDLGGTQVTDKAAAIIARWKHLKTLRLAWTRVTDRCFEELKALPNLENLQIYHTSLTDAGLDDLAQCTKLRYVSLDQTKVTAAGIEKLRKRLPRCVIRGVNKDFPQLEPDYATLAPGKWVGLLSSEQELEKLVANHPFRQPGSEPNWGRIKYEDGRLRLTGSGVYFPDVAARDVVIRANVTKESGRSVHLHFQTADKKTTYTLVFTDKWNRYQLGRIVDGTWTTLMDTVPDQQHSDSCELAFASVGNTLRAYVNGQQIIEYQDDAVKGPEFPVKIPGVSALSGPQQAVGLFRNIEVQNLDAQPQTGREPLPAGSVWKGSRSYRKGGYSPSTVAYELHVRMRDGTKFVGHKFDNGRNRNRVEVEGEIEGSSINWRERNMSDPQTVLTMKGTLENDTIRIQFKGRYSNGAWNEGDGELKRVTD